MTELSPNAKVLVGLIKSRGNTFTSDLKKIKKLAAKLEDESSIISTSLRELALEQPHLEGNHKFLMEFYKKRQANFGRIITILNETK